MLSSDHSNELDKKLARVQKLWKKHPDFDPNRPRRASAESFQPQASEGEAASKEQKKIKRPVVQPPPPPPLATLSPFGSPASSDSPARRSLDSSTIIERALREVRQLRTPSVTETVKSASSATGSFSESETQNPGTSAAPAASAAAKYAQVQVRSPTKRKVAPPPTVELETEVEDEYEEVEVEVVEEVEVEEDVEVERIVEVEQDVEIDVEVEELVQGFEPEVDMDKFVALEDYPFLKPLVVTFLKMSANNDSFGDESDEDANLMSDEDANLMLLGLSIELDSFEALEEMVKNAVGTDRRKVSLSTLREALKSKLEVAYDDMGESKFLLFVCIVKEHFFGKKPEPKKVKSTVKKVERKLVKKKVKDTEKRVVRKQQVKKVKKLVKRAAGAKSTALPEPRNPGALESASRGNPRDPRLRRKSGKYATVSEPFVEQSPRGPAQPPPPIAADDPIADPIIVELFMPSEPTPPAMPPPAAAATAGQPMPLTQGTLLSVSDSTEEAFPRELFHDFKVEVLVTKELKRYEYSYLVCYAPLRPEQVADCNSIKLVVHNWAYEKTGFKNFKVHYLACNLIIIRVFSKLFNDLQFRKTLNVARGFYPRIGNNQPPDISNKRIDPSFQVARKCRIIHAGPEQSYLIGANESGETFFMIPKSIQDGKRIQLGDDVSCKSVALPEKIRKHMSRYNDNCFVADNLALLTRDHIEEMQDLLNLTISVNVAKDLGIAASEQKDLSKVDDIIKKIIKSEFDIPSVIIEDDDQPEPGPPAAQVFNIKQEKGEPAAPAEKQPTTAQVFNIKRERNPSSDGRQSNSSAETLRPLTRENLEQLENLYEVSGHVSMATANRNSPPQDMINQERARAAEEALALAAAGADDEYVACGEEPDCDEGAQEKTPSPGPPSRPGSRSSRRKRSEYSSPSPVESPPTRRKRPRREERTAAPAADAVDDEEHSWRMNLAQQRDGELELGIDRLLSDTRCESSRQVRGASRAAPGDSSRGRSRDPSGGRNAGNITDGFEIEGLGRGKLLQCWTFRPLKTTQNPNPLLSVCNTHNVKLEPCVPYHTKSKCPKAKKGCKFQHGFPMWLPNPFCLLNLHDLRCDGRCDLIHGTIIELITHYQSQLKSAVRNCRECQNLRGKDIHPSPSEREDHLPNAYRPTPNDDSTSKKKKKKKKKNRANSEEGGGQSADEGRSHRSRSRERGARRRPESGRSDSRESSSELEIVESRIVAERRRGGKRRRSRSSRSEEKDDGRRSRSIDSTSSSKGPTPRKRRYRKRRDSSDDSSSVSSERGRGKRHKSGRRERSKSRSSRDSTRSRSRDRSVRSSDRHSLAQSSDLGAGSAKSRLGPKSSRSRSSSGEWRKCQENRSNSRPAMRSQTSNSRSPISKRLGPKISPSVK